MSLLDEYVKDLKEISTLLAVSHASKGGTVLIKRHNKTLLNPSAYSTINAWTPKHKIIQTSLLEMINTGDGGKLSTFIITSILISLNKLETQERMRQIDLLEEGLKHILKEIKSNSLSCTKESLTHLGKEDLEVSESLISSLMLGGHISLQKGDKVGVEVEDSESLKTEIVTLDLDKERTLKGCLFALFDERLVKNEQVQEALELMGTFPNRPLIIIAPMISKEIRGMIKLNDEKGNIECVCVESPRTTYARGWLEDIASYTGATLFNSSLDKEFETHFYGSALEVYLSHNQMVIDPYEDHIDTTLKRASFLLHEADTIINHPHTQDLWRNRANALTGSLIKIKIGSYTDTESRVRRNKAEKILLSMSDMKKNGYVVNPIKILYEIQSNNSLLDRSLKSPFRVICQNLNRYDLTLLDELEDDYFPTGRLCSLLTRVISISKTISNCVVSIKK